HNFIHKYSNITAPLSYQIDTEGNLIVSLSATYDRKRKIWANNPDYHTDTITFNKHDRNLLLSTYMQNRINSYFTDIAQVIPITLLINISIALYFREKQLGQKRQYYDLDSKFIHEEIDENFE